MSKPDKFVIIGAGPVGLAAAIVLAQEGYSSEVFEGRNEILNDYEQSYPIGINPRTLNTLNMISSELEEKAKQTGIIINAWEIYSGTRRVANQTSGTVYGTSRAKINLLLYETALKYDLIKVVFNHKLVKIDADTKTLTFEVIEKDSEKKLITVSGTRILACDGVNSKVRSYMDTECTDFKCEIFPWTNEYRVLFSKSGATSQELDPLVHYIFNSCYCATIQNDGEKLWCVSLTAKDSDDEETQNLLLSNDPSEENKGKLLAYIKKNAPRVYPFFENNDQEIEKYFKRRSYRGAVVKCNKFNLNEWTLDGRFRP